MTTFGWWDGVDGTGTQNQDASVTATWIYGNSDSTAATKADDGISGSSSPWSDVGLARIVVGSIASRGGTSNARMCACATSS